MSPTPAEDDASAAQALSAAADLPDEGETQVILFAGTTANEFLAQRLNPTESLAAGFRDIARDFASDALRKRTPVRYSAGRRPCRSQLLVRSVLSAFGTARTP